MIAQEIATAVQTRVATVLTIFDGHVDPPPAGPYAVFTDAAPQLFSRRLVAVASRHKQDFRLICVGRDPAECRHVVKLVLGVLANWRFAADRGTSWVQPVPNGAPILPDRSVAGLLRYSQTLDFTVATQRSTS